MIDLKERLAELPPVFGRKSLSFLLPGVISPKSLANAAWRGDGPPFYKLGRLVVYERTSFVSWLVERRIIKIEN
jgi:hypothetical protein